ncbi:MAG: glycosyltransferase family 2 protein [Chitinophagales bacterium]
MKKISVIIPCRNEKDFIQACIQSIVDADYPEELLEIIVCDGLSDDGTLSILEALRLKIPILHIVINQRRITPVARNLGVRYATGDYLLIFDAHAEMTGNYLLENATILDQKPDVWCSGGIWKNCFTNELSKNIARAMSSPFGVGNAYFRTGQHNGYADTVGMPMYRKEVFTTVGLFDESLIRNQDDEFNYRVEKAGGRIWLTTATYSNYFVRPSWKKLFSQYYQYGYWKVYVNRKHHTVTTARQMVPLFFVVFLLTGLIVSFFQLHLNNLYLFILIVYTALAIGSAAKFSIHAKDLLQIVMSFFILHFSYGTGYAKGIIDFLLLQRQPSRTRIL